MDIFSTLSLRIKAAIAVSTTFLLVVAIGLLLFGQNVLGNENELIEQAAGAARADMLYVHPEGH